MTQVSDTGAAAPQLKVKTPGCATAHALQGRDLLLHLHFQASQLKDSFQMPQHMPSACDGLKHVIKAPVAGAQSTACHIKVPVAGPQRMLCLQPAMSCFNITSAVMQLTQA